MIFFILLFNLAAQAAPRVNNGGGVWVCTQREEIGWIQAADFFELPVEERTKEQLPGLSTKEIMAAKAALIKGLFPELDNLLRKWPLDFAQAISWVPFPLSPTQDMNFQSRPQPGDCVGGTVHYEQLADFIYGDRLLIYQPLWENPKLQPIDQAAILLHEWIYHALREDRDEQTSARTRTIVAWLFSGADPTLARKKIANLLSFSSHDQLEDELATFPVAPRCDAFVDGVLVGGWQSLTEKFGEQVSFAYDDLTFTLETSSRDGVPEYLAIESRTDQWKTELDKSMARAAFLRVKRLNLNYSALGPRARAVRFVCWNQI